MSRDVRVEFRFKNARLLDAIEARWGKIIDQVWQSKIGNQKSGRPVVAEAAKLAQVRPSTMGELLRMGISAYDKRSGEPKKAVRRIAEALDEPIESLFPPSLCSENIPGTHAYISEHTFLSLSDTSPRAAIAPSPDEQEEAPEAIVERYLSTLLPREEAVLRARFGLDGEPETLAQIGDRYALSKERIRGIEAKALRKIRRKHRKEVQR
jgi:RNA polymerase sigma factor (sigma-70 family)